MRMSANQVRARSLAVVLGLAAVFALSVPSYALDQVVLQGTHSEADVKKACDGVGGHSIEGADGKGYGCYNPNNGVMVACADNGKCTGYIPRGSTRATSFAGVLMFGLGGANPPDTKSLGSGDNDGGSDDSGSPCGPDGCLY